MSFQPCDRGVLWELGYWAGTLRRWYGQGLPRRHGIRDDLAFGDSIAGEAMPHAHDMGSELAKLFPTKDTRDVDVHECLGLDRGMVMLPVNTSLAPAFTAEVIEDRPESRLVMDGFGVTKEVRKDAGCLPRFCKWPVESAVLINTSRGGLVDEKALIRALQTGCIDRACLDVLETEPPHHANPLLDMDSVILSPHSAACSEKAFEDLRDTAMDEVIRAFRGRLPLSLVNPDVTGTSPLR